jgi:hypothetical protein
LSTFGVRPARLGQEGNVFADGIMIHVVFYNGMIEFESELVFKELIELGYTLLWWS